MSKDLYGFAPLIQSADKTGYQFVIIMYLYMCVRVLQYTSIFSNFQYLLHTGINNDDTGILCVLKIA